MKGYSTKYALTQGIQEVEVEPLDLDVETKYRYVTSSTTIVQQLETGIDFFDNRDAAEEAAKMMAKRKVISLNRQLDKMKPLTRKPRWSNK